MAGQIIRRGERTWLVRVFLGRDSQTGKRRHHNKTIHGTAKNAQRYLNGVLRDLDLGTFVEPSTMTVNEYLDRWLVTAAAPRLSERSLADYTYLLEKYVRPALGGRRLAEVQPLDIQSFYTSMQEAGLGARSVRYVHAVLSSAFRQAVKWRMLVQNSCAVVDLPRQARKEMLALSPEEASRFLSAAHQDPWCVLFSVALTTGMRPEEYLALQWKDVDLKEGTATVQRTLCWRTKGGGWYFGETKTSGSRRTVPLPNSVARSLQEHRRNQAEERLRAGSEYRNLDLVFANSFGGPLDPNNLRRRHLKPILQRAGLPTEIRLYDLRHSCATLLLAGGENPKVVSERLGHASVTLTLDIYSHVLPSMQQAATEKLEKLLFAGAGTQ